MKNVNQTGKLPAEFFVPTEKGAPAPEYAAPAPEFSAPAPEFSAPCAQTDVCAPKKRRKLRLYAFFAAAAVLLVFGGLFSGSFDRVQSGYAGTWSVIRAEYTDTYGDNAPVHSVTDYAALGNAGCYTYLIQEGRDSSGETYLMLYYSDGKTTASDPVYLYPDGKGGFSGGVPLSSGNARMLQADFKDGCLYLESTVSGIDYKYVTLEVYRKT